MSVTKRDQAAPPAQADLGAAEGAAVVLALLGESSLGALSGKLSPDNRARLAQALESLRDVDRPQQEAIAARFAAALARRRVAVAGGPGAAARLSGQIYGVSGEDQPAPERPAEPAPLTLWARVEALGPAPLARFLNDCAPPVAAIALDALPEAFAAEVAGEMAEPGATSGLVQLARAADANPLALAAVELAVEQALFGEDAPTPKVDLVRAERVAGVLNRLPTARRLAALAALRREVEPGLLAAIEERVLGFEDLHARLPRSVVPVLFRELDEAVLKPALAFAPTNGRQTAEYLFANISQRLAAQIREGLPAGVEPAKGESAQAQVVGFVLGLVREGRAELIEKPAA